MLIMMKLTCRGEEVTNILDCIGRHIFILWRIMPYLNLIIWIQHLTLCFSPDSLFINFEFCPFSFRKVRAKRFYKKSWYAKYGYSWTFVKISVPRRFSEAYSPIKRNGRLPRHTHANQNEKLQLKSNLGPSSLTGHDLEFMSFGTVYRFLVRMLWGR